MILVALVAYPPFALAQQPVGNLPASNSVVPATTVPPTVAISIDDQYRIGPGDLIAVQVFNKPQLSRETYVDTRGKIAMPLLEVEIQAACRTEKELSGEIARLYREGEFLKNPVVYVTVKEYQSQPVAVMGAVNSPGRFQLKRRIRLLELLVFQAGGPSAKAGTKVQILSTVPNNPCQAAPVNPPTTENSDATNTDAANTNDGVVTYNLNDLLQGDQEINPYVRQGDIINIPAAEEVIIIGKVARPAAITLGESLTLGRAIAMVGGMLPDSRKDKIRITRQIAGTSATTELLVDLKATDKTQGEGFLLQGGDVVEVSTKNRSGLQNVLRGLATSLIPMATRVPIVVP